MALNADKIPVIDLGRGLTDCLARLGLGKLLDTLTIATTSRSSDRWGSVIPRPSQWRSCLSGCGCQIEDFSRKTTIGHHFAEYLPFPVEFCKKWQNMLKDGDDHWRPFIFPGKSPVVIHFSHQPSNMIYVMMENMLRWRAGHGAATEGRKQFLVTWSRNLQTQWPSPQRPRRCRDWAQETKVKVLQQRREVAATGSSCHIGQGRWHLATH